MVFSYFLFWLLKYLDLGGSASCQIHTTKPQRTLRWGRAPRLPVGPVGPVGPELEVSDLRGVFFSMPRQLSGVKTEEQQTQRIERTHSL